MYSKSTINIQQVPGRYEAGMVIKRDQEAVDLLRVF